MISKYSFKEYHSLKGDMKQHVSSVQGKKKSFKCDICEFSIFLKGHADNLSLMRCKEISRSWCDFIDNQKFKLIRIIKKYVKESNHEYTECPKYWEQLFRRSNTQQVANLASEILWTVYGFAVLSNH